MNSNIDIESVLRASLAEHADSPGLSRSATALAEQTIDAATRGTDMQAARGSRAFRWRTLALPLLAAGSVAAVVVGLLAADHFRQTSEHQPAATPTISAPISSPAPQPTATTAPTTVTSSPGQSPTDTVLVGPVGGPVPSAFKIIDLTYIGTTQGWALGSADCENGPGVCTAIVRTINGGTSWVGLPTPPAHDVFTSNGCAAPCIQHLRFANQLVGYAFGPSSLFMTVDGGATWTKQSGGADALETLDDNVIRISDSCGCAPGATYRVQTAAIGSTDWTSVSLPGGGPVGDGVSLTRTGSNAYFEVYEHPAGGSSDAQSTLYSSTNDGKTWTNRGEPCAQSGNPSVTQEVDSSALTSAPDGSVTVLCAPRGVENASEFTATSTDNGASFTPSGGLPKGGISAIGSASASVLLAAWTDDTELFRSADGGRTWHQVAMATKAGAAEVFLGFETPTVGRWVSNGGTTVWTTTDAGLTWTSHTFS